MKVKLFFEENSSIRDRMTVSQLVSNALRSKWDLYNLSEDSNTVTMNLETTATLQEVFRVINSNLPGYIKYISKIIFNKVEKK